MNRREMLGLMGAAVAHSLSNLSSRAWGYTQNERLNVGAIGTGGRFRHLMKAFQKIPGVRLTAVCDVWDKHLEMAREIAGPRALATRDYHELLEQKDIDAVIIASPDHWHVPMTVDACAANKDVYVEKPLTHNLAEGRMVIDAKNKYKRIVQVGMQQRSMPHIQKAYEIVKSGRLGSIHKAHLTWNRNSARAQKKNLGIAPESVDWKRFLGSAKDQPFDDYRFRHWRWFWDFGGGILTDLMVHWLDVVHWFLDLDHPAEATAIGDNFMSKGVWETPDTIQTLLRYPDREMQVYFEGTFVNARNAAMFEIMGSNATLYVDRGRYEIHPERGKGKYEEMILGQGPRGADFYNRPDGELLHLTDWIQCVRSRGTPCAPVEAGVSAVSGAHLGNQAYRSGQLVRWK
ncbi:MAG: Gfo/Idh/MocA family oxidoreductase [Planctomycetota bacterium]|nr:MAG: Gfo/Idh/MocA family oxidoreductase [Planctomycetota bacterium]